MPSKDNLWLTPRIKTVSSGKWASKAHPEAKALRCLPSCPPCPPPPQEHTCSVAARTDLSDSLM